MSFFRKLGDPVLSLSDLGGPVGSPFAVLEEKEASGDGPSTCDRPVADGVLG